MWVEKPEEMRKGRTKGEAEMKDVGAWGRTEGDDGEESGSEERRMMEDEEGGSGERERAKYQGGDQKGSLEACKN